LTSRGASAVSHAADSVSQFAQQAGGRLREHYGDVTDAARERYDRAQDLVRHNPTQSIAAAFGVGLVAGLVVGPGAAVALSPAAGRLAARRRRGQFSCY